MQKIKTLLAGKTSLKISAWAVLVLAGLFILLVIVRAFHLYNLDKVHAAVAKIHDSRLIFADVTKEYLPPDPGPAVNATIAGIDANNNGIRDDVEIAIFKAYPNSAKTRAALLQYALVLQTEATTPIVNTDTATAVAEEDSRAYDCIGEIVPPGSGDIEKIENYRSFVESKQLNTPSRKDVKNQFDNNTGSFELQSGCDVDLKTLPN